MAEGVKVDKLLDFARETQQRRVHDIGQIASERDHVIAGLCRSRRGGPNLYSVRK